MKRLILLVSIVFLLCGCAAPAEPTTEAIVPPTTEAVPSIPWMETRGTAWDDAGSLTELSLTIPDGMHYGNAMAFDGDLLLWSTDDHRKDTYTVELCVVELDTGEVLAARDISFAEIVIPQVLEDHLYLCDSTSGSIVKLNKQLQPVQTWNLEPQEGSWCMGENTLYIVNWGNGVLRQELPDGDRIPLPGYEHGENYLSVFGRYAQIGGFDENTGAPLCAMLDLITGEILELPLRNCRDFVHLSNGNWICGSYDMTTEYYLCLADGSIRKLDTQAPEYRFTEDGYILASLDDSRKLGLYDLDGKNLGICTISANSYSNTVSELIPSDAFGGYFIILNNYGGDIRLLYWDLENTEIGEDLVFGEYKPLPEDMASLQQWADELSQEYGVYILIGSSCDTQFEEFTATITEDPDKIRYALDTLDQALGVYPEGFFRQLRFDGVQGIRFQLICDLMADGSGRYGDGYIAFAEQQWDHYLVVVDIDNAVESTYYHEISHVIDSFLESKSWQLEDPLYSDAAWCELNPDWFTGYSYDYSHEHVLQDYTSFIDSYSTVSPTEDRARVLEYAMADYGEYMFMDCPVLLDKLQYYCDCIRDGFDTTGWPEELPWEQYLYLAQ